MHPQQYDLLSCQQALEVLKRSVWTSWIHLYLYYQLIHMKKSLTNIVYINLPNCTVVLAFIPKAHLLTWLLISTKCSRCLEQIDNRRNEKHRFISSVKIFNMGDLAMIHLCNEQFSLHLLKIKVLKTLAILYCICWHFFHFHRCWHLHITLMAMLCSLLNSSRVLSDRMRIDVTC